MDSGTGPLFCREDGTGGPVLVLLHGFGGSHVVWRDITQRLSRRCRILAYDLPGHGTSLNAGHTTAKAAANAVLSDLRSRGVQDVHVVGHSFGGAVAVLMAVLDPALVASIVLLAPGGIGPDIDGAALMRLARAVTPSEMAEALGGMSAPATQVDPDKAAALAAVHRHDGQVDRLVEIATAISAGNRQGVFPAEMLAGISCPVDVAWGTLDPVLPFAQASALPASFALTTITGAGHMLIEEAPDIVAALVETRLP
jgi:pimeloyl-ACP methyl ester carboxylesterase